MAGQGRSSAPWLDRLVERNYTGGVFFFLLLAAVLAAFGIFTLVTVPDLGVEFRWGLPAGVAVGLFFFLAVAAVAGAVYCLRRR